MSAKYTPYSCGECGEGTMQLCKAPYTVSVGKETYAIPEVAQLRCDHCGAVSFTPGQLEELDYRSACAVRASKGLISPDEIRELRRLLQGLTQTELEDILKVGRKTVVRWEAGVVHQTQGIDQLLRMYLAIGRESASVVQSLSRPALIALLQQLPELMPKLIERAMRCRREELLGGEAKTSVSFQVETRSPDSARRQDYRVTCTGTSEQRGQHVALGNAA